MINLNDYFFSDGTIILNKKVYHKSYIRFNIPTKGWKEPVEFLEYVKYYVICPACAKTHKASKNSELICCQGVSSCGYKFFAELKRSELLHFITKDN